MQEKQALKRLVPGKDAGNIIDENLRLKDQNEEMVAKIETLRAELQIAERRLEDEKVKQYGQEDEIRTYKEALNDIKREICEPQNFLQTDEQLLEFHQQNFKPILAQDFSTEPSTIRLKSKRGAPKTKGKTLSRRDMLLAIN